MILDAAFRWSVVLFVVGSVAGAGLSAPPRQALLALTQVRFVVVSLVGGWVVAPAVAYLLLQVIPLAQPYAMGLLLLSLAPCAPFAPPLVRAARGDPASLAAFILLSGVTTVIFMPIGVPLLIAGLDVAPWTIAQPLVMLTLAPLVLGMVLRGVHEQVAARVDRVAAAVTQGSAIVLLVLTVILYGRGVADAVGSFAIGTQMMFEAILAVAAYLLSAGLPNSQRSVLTIGLTTRNLGAALAPLAALDADPRVVVMVILAAPVTFAVAALAARIVSRGAHPEPAV
jgi:BASS family bile acid:Na+ symporter